MADVLLVFSNAKINISEMTSRDTEDGHSMIYLTVAVSGREQLEMLMNRVRRCAGIIDVFRNISGSEG